MQPDKMDSQAVERASFRISVSACRHSWLRFRFPIIRPIQLENFLGNKFNRDIFNQPQTSRSQNQDRRRDRRPV
jgi:hypothetical protein